MTTTTTYRAQTDPTTKNWHLGTVEAGPKSVCGVTLITPDDTRAFARKVADDKRHFETSDELERVTCGSCRRNREWGYAHGAARPADRQPATTTRRRAGSRRRPATVEATPETRTDPTGADASAGAAAEANADAAAAPSTTARKRRQSRADKAAAKTAADRQRREALAAEADATVANIEAAVATVSPE